MQFQSQIGGDKRAQGYEDLMAAFQQAAQKMNVNLEQGGQPQVPQVAQQMPFQPGTQPPVSPGMQGIFGTQAENQHLAGGMSPVSGVGATPPPLQQPGPTPLAGPGSLMADAPPPIPRTRPASGGTPPGMYPPPSGQEGDIPMLASAGAGIQVPPGPQGPPGLPGAPPVGQVAPTLTLGVRGGQGAQGTPGAVGATPIDASTPEGREELMKKYPGLLGDKNIDAPDAPVAAVPAATPVAATPAATPAAPVPAAPVPATEPVAEPVARPTEEDVLKGRARVQRLRDEGILSSDKVEAKNVAKVATEGGSPIEARASFNRRFNSISERHRGRPAPGPASFGDNEDSLFMGAGFASGHFHLEYNPGRATQAWVKEREENAEAEGREPGAPPTAEMKRRYQMGHVVRGLRAIFNQTGGHNATETQLLQRKGSYTALLKNWSKGRNWDGGTVGHKTVEGRARQLASYLSGRNRYISMRDGQLAAANIKNPSAGGDPTVDNAIADELSKGLTWGDYKVPEGLRGATGGHWVTGTSDEAKLNEQHWALRQVNAGLPPGERNLSLRWDDPRVLRALMLGRGGQGRRFGDKDHFFESIKLAQQWEAGQEDPGMATLNDLAAAWADVDPKLGEKFHEAIMEMALPANGTLIDSGVGPASKEVIAMEGLNRQLVDLSRKKAGLPGLGAFVPGEAGGAVLEPVHTDFTLDGIEVRVQEGEQDLGEESRYDQGLQRAVWEGHRHPTTGEWIDSTDPRFNPDLVKSVLTPEAQAARRKATEKEAAAAQKAQDALTKKKKTEQAKKTSGIQQLIEKETAEMTRRVEEERRKQAGKGPGTAASLAAEAKRYSDDLFKNEVSQLQEKLTKEENLLTFGRLLTEAFVKMGDGMTQMAAGLRPREQPSYIPTSIYEAINAVGKDKEAALMRLNVWSMTGHMFAKGTSAESMKAQIPLLQHTQNLQQRNEQFLATMKQKEYQSWLDYRQNVLKMKIDWSKEEHLRERFEREYAHRREYDAKKYALEEMKYRMEQHGETLGNGTLSAVQLATIDALKSTIMMGEEVLREKPNHGTGWIVNFYQSAGNYFGWADPAWHAFKQKVTYQLNTYVNNLTGKQLSKHEVGRLKGVVPQMTDSDAVFTEKAKTFIRVQRMLLNRKLKTYSLAGFNVDDYVWDNELTYRKQGGQPRTSTYAALREQMARDPSLLGKLQLMTGPQGRPVRQGEDWLGDVISDMLKPDENGVLRYNEEKYGAVDPREQSAAWGDLTITQAGIRAAAKTLKGAATGGAY